MRRLAGTAAVLWLAGVALAGESGEAVKPGFTRTTRAEWIAKESAAQKVLREELGRLKGRIVFAMGLGGKEGSGRGAKYKPVAEGEGNWDIYSARPDGTDLVNLTKHPARDGYPRVSADGKRIAFTSDRELPAGKKLEYCYEGAGLGSIVVMNADGSDQRKVADGCTVAWSPDGKRLAYVREKQIFMREIESGKEVVQTSKNWRKAMYPDFTGEGSHLVSTGNVGRGWVILGWAFDPATMQPKGSAVQVSGTSGCNADLMPDDRGFVYVQDHAGDTFSRLYLTPFDASDMKRGRPKVIPFFKERLWQYYPAPSPCGKYVVFSLGPGGKSLGEGWTMVKEQELYVGRIEGGVTVRVTFGGRVCKHPHWSAALE